MDNINKIKWRRGGGGIERKVINIGKTITVSNLVFYAQSAISVLSGR